MFTYDVHNSVELVPAVLDDAQLLEVDVDHAGGVTHQPQLLQVSLVSPLQRRRVLLQLRDEGRVDLWARPSHVEAALCLLDRGLVDQLALREVVGAVAKVIAARRESLRLKHRGGKEEEASRHRDN